MLRAQGAHWGKTCWAAATPAVGRLLYAPWDCRRTVATPEKTHRHTAARAAPTIRTSSNTRSTNQKQTQQPLGTLEGSLMGLVASDQRIRTSKGGANNQKQRATNSKRERQCQKQQQQQQQPHQELIASPSALEGLVARTRQDFT